MGPRLISVEMLIVIFQSRVLFRLLYIIYIVNVHRYAKKVLNPMVICHCQTSNNPDAVSLGSRYSTCISLHLCFCLRFCLCFCLYTAPAPDPDPYPDPCCGWRSGPLVFFSKPENLRLEKWALGIWTILTVVLVLITQSRIHLNLSVNCRLQS